MKLDYAAPKPYHFGEAMLDEHGRITRRVANGLENVLAAYADIAAVQAANTDNNLRNYRVASVKLVGSGARENQPDSDLDLLLEVPALDSSSANHMKTLLALIFFTDRPKREAVDVFVRPQDAYPERASKDITGQVRHLLREYNSKLV